MRNRGRSNDGISWRIMGRLELGQSQASCQVYVNSFRILDRSRESLGRSKWGLKGKSCGS